MRRAGSDISRIILLFFLLFFFIIVDIALGTVKIPFADVLKQLTGTEGVSTQHALILKSFRIPRVLTALLAGAALSVSGLQMQTIFRNPLAGPYVLGISSGASLGAAIVILGAGALGGSFLAQWGLVAASWVGAGAVLLLLLLVSLRIRNIMTILILGIMFSSALSAIISLMQYFGTAAALKSFVIWTMGSLGNVTGNALWVLFLSVIPGLTLAFFSVKGLNAVMLGEGYAGTVGINVRRTRTMVFISTSILAGTCTAFCGPIGFIGIAVPHIARFLLRTADMKRLMPYTILLGMIVLVLSDIISQVPGSDRIFPINAITSLIGIPVVIWVVISRRNTFS